VECRGPEGLRIPGDLSVEAGRIPGQPGWYAFAARFARGKTVLDVGCGLGLGLDILAGSAAAVTGQEVDPRLATRPEVLIRAVESFPDKSVDVVTAIEVVELVEDDLNFLRHLVRIARDLVFLTTPNWAICRCRWPYHRREYAFHELEALLGPLGRVEFFKGDAKGTVVHPVRRRRPYRLLNELRARPATAFLTRCLNRFLPSSVALHAHHAALIRPQPRADCSGRP
jgi:SAM-dependent methyltransferase